MEKRTQISFEINPRLHKDIKVRAAMQNITMNLWIMRALLAAIEREDKGEK